MWEDPCRTALPVVLSEAPFLGSLQCINVNTWNWGRKRGPTSQTPPANILKKKSNSSLSTSPMEAPVLSKKGFLSAFQDIPSWSETTERKRQKSGKRVPTPRTPPAKTRLKNRNSSLSTVPSGSNVRLLKLLSWAVSNPPSGSKSDE